MATVMVSGSSETASVNEDTNTATGFAITPLSITGTYLAIGRNKANTNLCPCVVKRFTVSDPVLDVTYMDINPEDAA